MKTTVNLKLLFWQSVAIFLAFALVLFLPAGTLAWPAGWAFLVLFFGFYVGLTSWLFLYNPSLVQERTKLASSDQQGWDKILFPIMLAYPFAWIIFMSLDAVRFHWSPLPIWLQWVGAVLLLVSFYMLFLTFRENSFLSPVVRLQKDRGQTVISTGPYHYVRHPMYAALLVFLISTPFLLGSGYGVLLGLFYVVILARRAVMEENTLQSQLPGYTAYVTQVKYRFIPYIW
jgi:protein-S-isoprenylcysteine O-methyltransferase Ste14